MRIEHWFYTVPLRLRSLFRRQRLEDELNEELQYHMEQKAERYIAAGMPPEEARRAALRDMDGLERHKEECRDMRRVNFIKDLLKDLQFGLRQLRRNPGFTVATVITLALGIGANTAIFTLLNAVVLAALPVHRPEQLVIFSQTYADGSENSNLSWPYFERIRTRNRTLSSVFAFMPLGRVNVGFHGQASLAIGQIATGQYFSTLGLKPAAGRFFSDEDDKARRPVAVISYAFWQRRFGGDPTIVGKPITVNQVPFTVIGVTPAAFAGLQVGDSLDITVPMMQLNHFWPGPPDWNGAFDSWLEIMGRLKPGIDRHRAQAEFDVIYHHLLTDYAPRAGPDQKPSLSQMMRSSRLNVKPGGKGYEWGLRHEFSLPLQILMMTVALVLLIACANLANLLLARATTRQKEIAVRLAVGASRLRLIRQLLTEGILLAAMGGLVGFLIAWWGSQFLLRMVSTGQALSPVNLAPDLRILAFTAGVSLLTGILFGLAPALRATRVDLTPALKEGRCQSGSQAHNAIFAVDRVLVVAQIAISLTLLIGAGLFVRSLQELWAINPGYDRQNVLMFSLDPRLAGYKDTAKIDGLYRRLMADLQSLPGARSVSLSLVRPVDDEAYWVNMVESIDGRKLPEGHGIHVAVNALGPGYFQTLETPMLLGREFGPEDNRKSAKVALISETLAHQCFGKTDPIGRRIADHDDGEVQVVGVVKDSRYASVRDLPRGVLYLPLFQENLAEIPFATTFEVRYSGDLPPLLNLIRHQLKAIDSSVPVSRVKTLEMQTRDSFVTYRLIATVSTFFGLLAMLIACLGLYGTIAYGVARRTGEIGLRMALGAQTSDVLRLVVGQGMILTLLGVGLGIIGALGITRFLSSLLYGVKPTDPATIFSGSLILIAVALLACYIPARRATKVDPMVALRHE